MTENLSTWSEVVSDAEAWVSGAVQSGELDLADDAAVSEWVWETADGSAHVIYAANARSLAFDPVAPDVSDDVRDVAGPTTDLDRLATLTAYCLVERALNEVIERAREDADNDSVPRCPACGQEMDYCLGHGEIGDPVGAAILAAHDDGDHSRCDSRGCDDTE